MKYCYGKHLYHLYKWLIMKDSSYLCHHEWKNMWHYPSQYLFRRNKQCGAAGCWSLITFNSSTDGERVKITLKSRVEMSQWEDAGPLGGSLYGTNRPTIVLKNRPLGTTQFWCYQSLQKVSDPKWNSKCYLHSCVSRDTGAVRSKDWV